MLVRFFSRNLHARRTVPIAMNASSNPKVCFLRRMYVLNPTATKERPRNMKEMTMMASGKPSGDINLAEGSVSLEGVAIVDLG